MEEKTIYEGDAIVRPSLKLIKERYQNTKRIKSIWGNEFSLEKYDISKPYRLNDTDIFIPYKDKENDHKDICVYDWDTNKYAEIVE